jgi:alpha-ketoglutarate-dependent taurine dioxygenase
MSHPPSPTAPGLSTIRRRIVDTTPDALVSATPWSDDPGAPLVLAPRQPDVSLTGWTRAHREAIAQQLVTHGALLLRGFAVQTPERFEETMRGLFGELLDYRERSSPRRSVAGKIYSSTEYPPAYPIFPHNENSYQREWPWHVGFCCLQPPAEGGATPIVSTRALYQRLPPRIRDAFREKGVCYVRNYREECGLPWQDVFQTSDAREVEAYGASHGIAIEWVDATHLRTRQVRPAIVAHPSTGEPVWFNHATFFHLSTLPAAIRQELLAQFGDAALPSQSYYGDGTPIEDDVLEELRHQYLDYAIRWPWQQDDVLVLDNVLTAHGREAYSGARTVLVAMADPVSRQAPKE